MRDIIEMSYEAQQLSTSTKKQKEVFSELFIKELSSMKGADIAPHLTFEYDKKKQECIILLVFPVASNSKNGLGVINNMYNEKIRETLEKQIDKLSECSKSSTCTACELAEISYAMAEIAKILMYPAWCQEVDRASRQC